MTFQSVNLQQLNISSGTHKIIFYTGLGTKVSMAFEVARVHELICSRVGDEGVFNPLKPASLPMEADQSFPRSCSPEGANLHMYHPAGFSYDSRGFDQGHSAMNLPTEVSSSTESESDREEDPLESLAQQIARSMLDEEEPKADVCSGVLKGNRYSGALDSANVDVNEGRVSPTGWSRSSWSSGPQLSGSQSSSKGSSRGSSQVSSPSSAPTSGYQDAWDTLYAAAGEVVRLKMNEEKKVQLFSGEGPSQTKVLNQALRAHLPQQTRPSGQILGRSTLHCAKRKEENLMASTQAQQNWAMKVAAMNAAACQGRSAYPMYEHQQQVYNLDGHRGTNNYRHPGKLVDNKSLQRNRQAGLNGGSGVRVVFLGGASGRESGGTGVFLPRTFTNTPEHKKKNDVASTHGCTTGVPIHAKSPREGVWPTLQQSMNRSSHRQPVYHEPCLPTEWTY